MGFTTALKYKTVSKKRSRANVPHGDPGPETKVCYICNTTNNPADDGTFAEYRSHPRCWGSTTQDITKAGQLYPYTLRPLVWPGQGTTIHGRVGASFRARLLRIKGVINVFDTVPAPIRVRMYYIYYKNHSTIAFQNVDYLKYYTAPLDPAGNPNTERVTCANNYYHGQWKDIWMNEPEFFKTKVLEFYIKPTTGAEVPCNPITSQLASTPASYGEHQAAYSIAKIWQVHNVNNEIVSRIPVDKTIYLNMTVNATQDSHWFYFETDEPAAYDTTNASVFGTANPAIPGFGNMVNPLTSLNVHPTVNITTSPIIFNFKTFYYFTDD